MQNVGIASAMISFVAGAGTVTLLYYAFRISPAWRGKIRAAARLADGRTRFAPQSLDTHIAAEWTDGRIRLDALLTVIKALAVLLDREVATRQRLNPSDPLHKGDAHNMAGSALRHFTFDQHLRNECRVLVSLLEFCGRDLAESRGVNTAEQLAALARIEAAIQAVDRG